MRRLRSLIILLILLLLTWFAYGIYRSLSMVDVTHTGVEFAQHSQAYVVTDEQWVQFPLSKRKSVIRILSNASLTPQDADLEDYAWKYAFHYQLLDRSGNLLHEKTYHHRSRATFDVKSDLDELQTRFFYDATTELIPTDGRVMLINLAGLETDVATLRLRLAEKDPSIVDTVVRVYEPDMTSEHKLAYKWQRMSQKKRAFVARGSVYPPELLRDEEKRNLTRDRWQPLGPAGVNGRDYQQRSLYTLRDYEGEIQFGWSGDILPQGLLVDPWVNGIIPLPETGGLITLELQPLMDSQSAQQAQLIWYGKGLGKKKEQTLPHQGQSFEYSDRFEGGLLELKANQLMVVRVYLDEGGIRQEITPEPIYLRSFTTSANLALDYHVDRFGKRASTMRFDLRLAMHSPEIALEGSADVSYKLLDAKGIEVSSGRLATNLNFSNYDRLLGAQSGYLSQAQRYFFHLPPEVKTIRFYSSTPVMVVAYSRPYDLIHKLRVPDDYYSYGEKDARQPAWFMVQPDNEHELLSTHRSRLLRVQTKPPEQDPLVMAGQFEWDSYLPEGNWAARYLLNTRDPSTPIRDQALSAIYHTVKPNQTTELQFVAEQFIKQIQPALIYLRPNDDPFQLKVYLDNKILYQEQLRSRRGEVRIPTITRGRHRLRIEAPSDSGWFINYVGRSEDAVIKRLAHRIEKHGLSFIYHKQTHEDEVLSAQFQVPANQTRRSKVWVTVTPQARERLQPYDNWTLDKRLFDIRPERNTKQAVLNTQSQWVEAGQRFFIPLGRELPPGQYRIKFKLEYGRQGYLSLSRLSGGLKESLKAFREHLFSDAENTP